MIQLIALDLDGTLLNSRKEPPKDFFRMVGLLHTHGIHVVLASGRQYFNQIKHFAPVADRLTFISENGGLIMDRGNLLSCTPFPREDLRTMLSFLQTIPGVTPLICGCRGAYTTPPDHGVESNISLYYEKRIYSRDPLEASQGDRIIKIAIFDQGDVVSHGKMIQEKFSKMFHVALAGPQWIDCMHPEVNKGHAVRFLQHHWGVRADQSMAFGDYLNDCEMLRAVEFSYAMSNGHPEAIRTARYLAPSNEEEGVAQILRQKFLFLR